MPAPETHPSDNPKTKPTRNPQRYPSLRLNYADKSRDWRPRSYSKELLAFYAKGIVLGGPAYFSKHMEV